MPSRFEQEWAARSPTLDAHYGERLHIEPQVTGEFIAGGADPGRPAYDVVGTFRPKSNIVPERHSLGGTAADNVNVAASLDQFSFLHSVLGDRARWPKQGDVITRIEKPGTPRFKISRTFPDGTVRHGCIVVPL